MHLNKVAAMLLLAVSACSADATAPENGSGDTRAAAKTETAVLAGGCFWCMESDLEKLDGVGDVVSGYAGGHLANPTYRNHTGHIEVVRAPFDPTVISYREILDYYFRHIDPLDAEGQFCDRGHSYTTAIFYQNADQYADALAAKEAAAQALGEPVATTVQELSEFWIAEDYHQDYYKKNPIRYKLYRTSCGRDKRVKEVWGK
ncbi:MAG: peptide-methionine (S)-S-oxide reductase MsrA [Pseudomonadota bacterium]